jgi:DNA-binding NarL/FixJ family response regulator
MTNPWGLTKRESEVLQALVMGCGSDKIAGAELRIAKQTISTLMCRARTRMRARTRFEALLMWDRWARDKQAGTVA